MYIVKVVENERERRDHESVRHQVYVREKAWIPERVDDDGREADEYDARSTLIVAYDLAGDPTGAVRLIHRADGSAEGRLPVEGPPFGCSIDDSRRAVEASRLAVVPEHRRNSLVMLGLCRLVVQEMQNLEADDCYAIVERPLLMSLRTLGFPFQRIMEPVDYFGGLVFPVVVPVADMADGAASNGPFADLFARPFNGVIGEEVHVQ